VVVVGWAIPRTEHEERKTVAAHTATRGRNIIETLVVQASSVGSVAVVS
jgi:hypothetical protein